MRMRVEGVKNAYLRRRHRLCWKSLSRHRSLRLIRRSKSRSRCLRLRLKMFVNPARRFGPRPSTRPSRASWQLTNFPHFLSRFEALRPRPWAIASDDANVSTMPTTRIPNRFLDVKSFIKVPPLKTPANEGTGPQLGYDVINSSAAFCDLLSSGLL